MYALFLSMLTASAGMEACVAAFENGSAWFGAWAEAGRGDVEPAEMAIIVEQVGAPNLAHISADPGLED